MLGHGNAKTLPLKTAEALDAVLVGKRAEEKQDLRNPGRDDAGASAGEGKKIDQGDDAKTPPSDAVRLCTRTRPVGTESPRKRKRGVRVSRFCLSLPGHEFVRSRRHSKSSGTACVIGIE